MKRTIDLTYPEISDNQKGTHLFGISTQTVKKAIQELEEQYFQGCNIFRNSGTGSDYLFRWEISDLLKLLIWLQATDVFNNKKASKSGVSAISIEKIVSSYDFISKANSLKDYERIALESSVQAQESKETLHYIERAYQSMSRFLLLATISYDRYPYDVFKGMAREFDDLTTKLNRNIHMNLAAQRFGNSHIKATKHGIISAEGLIPLTLNLKQSVVNAINRIAEEIYDFDENGICRRKATISDDKKTQDRYEMICGEHIYYSESGYTELNEDEIQIEGGINGIRHKIDNFMNGYFRQKYPQPDDDNAYEADKVNHLLRQPLKQYIEAFCWMNLLCKNTISIEQWNYSESPETCYKTTLRSRGYLSAYHHSGYKFDTYLSALEAKVLEKFASPEALNPNDDLLKITDQMVDEYLEDVKEYKQSTDQRMAGLDKLIGNQEEVKDNVKNICEQSEALLKNMLAIILKFESQETVQELLNQYYGAINILDYTAYEQDSQDQI